MKKILLIILSLSILLATNSYHIFGYNKSDKIIQKIDLKLEKVYTKISKRNLKSQISIYKKLKTKLNVLKNKYKTGKKVELISYIYDEVKKKYSKVFKEYVLERKKGNISKINCLPIENFKDNNWFSFLEKEFKRIKQPLTVGKGGYMELSNLYYMGDVGCFHSKNNIFIFANISGIYTYDITKNILIKNNYPYISFESGITNLKFQEDFVNIKSVIGGRVYYAKYYFMDNKVELYKKCAIKLSKGKSEEICEDVSEIYEEKVIDKFFKVSGYLEYENFLDTKFCKNGECDNDLVKDKKNVRLKVINQKGSIKTYVHNNKIFIGCIDGDKFEFSSLNDDNTKIKTELMDKTVLEGELVEVFNKKVINKEIVDLELIIYKHDNIPSGFSPGIGTCYSKFDKIILK